MDARHLIGLVLTPLALAVPANASAVTCDGPASVDNGAPQVLTGCGDAAVGQIAEALGTDPSDLDRMGPPAETPSGSVVRLAQSVDGIPVYGGQIALSFDRAGDLDMVQSSAIADPRMHSTPAVSSADALIAAGLGEGATAQLVIDPNGGSPILAWHAERVTETPSADVNAIVDAQTGALVRSWNAVQDVDSPGSKVFDPNPVQATGDTTLTNDTPPVPPGDPDLDNNVAPDAFRSTVTLTNLSSASSLDGDFATVTFPASAAPGAFSRVDTTPLQGNFEAVNVYYAITEAQKKIQSLGFPNFFQNPTPLLVNGDVQDNSNYNPGTQAITYGFGGVDDAEDSEVVLHEYGHAIQDAQVPGFGSGDEQGAMGEGFGDFFAGMFYLDKGDATYEQSHRRYCIAEWDATTYNPVDPANPGGGCLRWIDGTNESDGSDIGKYSNTPSEVHDDGRFWSAGMTCIFKGLGGDLDARNKTLKLVLDSQTRLVPIDDNTAFEAQIASMLTSDQNLFGGADVALIRDCANQRGLASLTETDPARDKTPPVVTPTVDPANPDGADGFYTGDVKVTWTVTDPESPATTNGCGPTTVDQNTGDSGITLTCTATSAGGMTSKSVTIKRRAKGSGGGGGNDNKPPKTTIGKHPNKSTHRRHARFQFDANENGSTFECSLDGGRFSKCHSPLKLRVKPGKHTLEIRATDAAGNVEKDPASFTWTVKARRHHR